MSKKHTIFWNDGIVGHADDLNVDNFHWYGKWIPSKTSSSDDFLVALAVLDKDADLWVGVDENCPTHTLAGEGIYRIKETEYIDMVWRPNPPETW